MGEADVLEITDLPQPDQDSIATTLLNLVSGFRSRDADKLVGTFTDDADWVNAFGTVQKGGAAIVEYQRALFADSNFNAGTVKSPPETSLQVLTPMSTTPAVIVGGGTRTATNYVRRQDDLEPSKVRFRGHFHDEPDGRTGLELRLWSPAHLAGPRHQGWLEGIHNVDATLRYLDAVAPAAEV